ncbi:MAG: type II secretion system F family protein, partial [Sphingomonadaceae bacterium]
SHGRASAALLSGLAGQVASRVRLASAADRAALATQLAAAGYRRPEAVSLYLLAGLLVPLSLAGLGAGMAPLLGAGVTLGAMAGLGVGLAAPRLWLRWACQRRRATLEAGFPDSLDLLVICVESGLSIDAALSRVARALAPARPELAEELGATAVELGFLPNRRDAFANLESRTGLASVQALVALLYQTERYGTPLAAALRTLASEARAAALLRVEERAARLPAILTVPMILFVLPPLFIVLVGPVIAQLLDR